MALERFLQKFPPGPDLPSVVSQKQERVDDRNPPLLYLLDWLILDLSEDVHMLHANFESYITVGDVGLMHKSAHEKLVATTLFIGLKGLIEWHNTGEFRHDVLRSRLNDALEHLPRKFKKPEWLINDRETIPLGKQAAMRMAAEGDPTFAVFFEKPDYMPQDMNRYFSEDLEIFKFEGTGEIVSNWKDVASSVVKPVLH